MIIYEVNVTVDAEIADDYAAWLGPHIQEILGLPGFVRASWYVRDAEEADPPTAKLWTIQYLLKDRKSLEDYLDSHAARLRQEAIDRFGTRFRATRRILQELHSL